MSEKSSGMNRRDFLWLLLGTGTAVLAQPTLGGLPQAWPSTVSPTALTAVFRHRESAIAVGHAYLTQTETTAVSLMGELAEVLGTAVSDWYTLGSGSIRQLLQTQIKADFAAEKTVKLQGWLVSLTEAKLCALVALTC